jgi:hypothetical protein
MTTPVRELGFIEFGVNFVIGDLLCAIDRALDGADFPMRFAAYSTSMP